MADWSEVETGVLLELYQEHDVPSDSLIADAEALDAFVERLNARLGGSALTTDDVANRLLLLRKNGDLPRLRR